MRKSVMGSLRKPSAAEHAPTLGSLFDGIGGFPLAAVHNGIVPVWASEIEAFPMEVTRLRFPDMIHVGDITKLDGAELPPVDIICGGSPCQDLSVAGARAGLAGALRPFYGTGQTRKGDEKCRYTARTDRCRCSTSTLGVGERSLCIEAHKAHYAPKFVM